MKTTNKGMLFLETFLTSMDLRISKPVVRLQDSFLTFCVECDCCLIINIASYPVIWIRTCFINYYGVRWQALPLWLSFATWNWPILSLNIRVSAITLFAWDLLTIILPDVNFEKTCVAICTFTMASEIAFFSFRLLSFSFFFNHFTNPPLELSDGTARISKALTCPRFGLDGQVISFFWWLKFPLLAIILDILVDWYMHWFPFSVELITCCVFLAFFWGFLIVVRFLCEGVTIHWHMDKILATHDGGLLANSVGKWVSFSSYW